MNKQHTGLQFHRMLCTGVVGLLCGHLSVAGAEGDAAMWEWPVPTDVPGKRYKAIVPDTLDLAERAGLAIHAITNLTNPDYD